MCLEAVVLNWYFIWINLALDKSTTNVQGFGTLQDYICVLSPTE